MPKKQTWYDKGFEEAMSGQMADPPYTNGNAHHDNYMSGFNDAHKQMDRIEQSEREAQRDA